MPERTLTESDIKAITDALQAGQHTCRFTDITNEQMYETVHFCATMNQAMKEDKRLIRRTLIVTGIGGIGSLILWGLSVRAKDFIIAVMK